MRLTETEKKLIEVLRSTGDPARAFETAVRVLTDYLKEVPA